VKIELLDTPRRFRVGHGPEPIVLSDCGSVHAQPDEQLTFRVPSGREYDVCRKDWGFYATPSTNGRLKRFGWRTALVRNDAGEVYVMLVEPEGMAAFEAYCAAESQRVLVWLDDDDAIARLAAVAEDSPEGA
jgi:hypothetical protein